MSSINDVVTLYNQLKKEWETPKANLSKCEQLLNELKIGLTNLIFLPTSSSTASKQELILARDVLEIGVQWSIEAKNLSAFERYMAQLKCYYFDYQNQLPESAFKYQLLGLNLLFLLSQNRVAEFHTELELLPANQIQENTYIRHPLSIEQFLMEGSYNKIFLAKGNVPAAQYNFFMDILLETIRADIALCLEKAYEKISPKDAARMLYLKTEEIARQYGTKQMNWQLDTDGFFHFNVSQQAKNKDQPEIEPIPSKQFAEQTIEYARELEMIV